MQTNELDYHLPDRLIAQQPSAERGESKLMVLHRSEGHIEHRKFSDIGEYLQPGDSLVLNDSRVIPAKFFLRRDTGGLIEGLFIGPAGGGQWQVMLKNATRLKIGETTTICRPIEQLNDDAPAVKMTVIEWLDGGQWLLKKDTEQADLDILERLGYTPLPPYIRRGRVGQEEERLDRQRYQTVYAQEPGSIAAPTAGLHFDERIIEQLQQNSVSIAKLILHVGMGTFKPVTTEQLEAHQMHSEYYRLDEKAAQTINDSKAAGGRIVAVGTTSVRTLETVANNDRVDRADGQTRLFIRPGYEFKIVDAILTNFHLPKTTLLALVCAMAGTEKTLAAYQRAIEKGYRFYSYGDAMLVI